MENKNINQVPPEGSLGLLALGHIGLEIWRKSRAEYKQRTGIDFQSFYKIEKTTNASEQQKIKNNNES